MGIASSMLDQNGCFFRSQGRSMLYSNEENRRVRARATALYLKEAPPHTSSPRVPSVPRHGVSSCQTPNCRFSLQVALTQSVRTTSSTATIKPIPSTPLPTPTGKSITPDCVWRGSTQSNFLHFFLKSSLFEKSLRLGTLFKSLQLRSSACQIQRYCCDSHVVRVLGSTTPTYSLCIRSI